MTDRDPFSVLGIPRDADLETARAAYERRLEELSSSAEGHVDDLERSRRVAEVERAWAEIRLLAYQAAAARESVSEGGDFGASEAAPADAETRRRRLEELSTPAMALLSFFAAIVAGAVAFAVLWLFSDRDHSGSSLPTTTGATGPLTGRFACSDSVGDPEGDVGNVAWDLVSAEAVLDGENLVVRFETAGDSESYGDARFVVERGPVYEEEGFELEITPGPGGYTVSKVTRREVVDRRIVPDAVVIVSGRAVEVRVPREQLPVFRQDMFWQWGAGVEGKGSDVCSELGD